jgi:chromosome segregation ATPase
MTFKEQKAKLEKRRNRLEYEISDIREEINVLLALMRKAEEEVDEVQSKLAALEEIETISLAYAS